MNPLDLRLAKVLKGLEKLPALSPKRQPLAAEFRELRSRVVAPELGVELDGLFAQFSPTGADLAKLTPDEVERSISLLRQRGFREIPGWLFNRKDWRAAVGLMLETTAVALAPSGAALEGWRKAAGKSASELAERLLQDPATAYGTSGLEWLLANVKPEKLTPVLTALLERRLRPENLPDWIEVLVEALGRDKNGALLESLLRQTKEAPDRTEALAEAVRSDWTLLRRTVDLMPVMLAKKEPPTSTVPFLSRVFAGLISTNGGERERLTAALARLGSSIAMVDRRGPRPNECLAWIANTMRELRNHTRDKENATLTWVLENLGQEEGPIEGRQELTLKGARQFSLAFEKLNSGYDAKDVLTATARNLGLTPFEKSGELIGYNPLRHEDLEGGMMPGDPCIVEETGWMHGKDLVVRAKVRKRSNHV